MRRIHQAAVRILGTVGMKIDHDEALDYLRDYGCRADREARRSAVNAIQGRCTIRGA
jgi:trimethylamine:corrinoid methyltransferase-like protein